jgi:ppGpp synthetase/RelA/SpoT-type nucleotidyltranferase
MKSSENNDSQLRAAYRWRFKEVLKPLESILCDYIKQYFDSQPRIDRITARAKGVESFVNKAENIVEGKLKYTEPLSQIQDQLGVRIVTFSTRMSNGLMPSYKGTLPLLNSEIAFLIRSGNSIISAVTMS